jgi:hypothetical protein
MCSSLPTALKFVRNSILELCRNKSKIQKHTKCVARYENSTSHCQAKYKKSLWREKKTSFFFFFRIETCQYQAYEFSSFIFCVSEIVLRFASKGVQLNDLLVSYAYVFKVYLFSWFICGKFFNILREKFIRSYVFVLMRNASVATSRVEVPSDPVVQYGRIYFDRRYERADNFTACCYFVIFCYFN